MDASREEVATAPPTPDIEVEVGDQPEEKSNESTAPNHELHMAARERAVNSLQNLADGTFEINNRVVTFCVVCGIRGTRWLNVSSTQGWWQQ